MRFASMNLVDLLWMRWQIRKAYSAPSMNIGGNGVWLFLARRRSDQYATDTVVTKNTYYLKLHWGSKQTRSYPVTGSFTDDDIKQGIQWLVDNNNIRGSYKKDITAYLKWYSRYLLKWKKAKPGGKFHTHVHRT